MLANIRVTLPRTDIGATLQCLMWTPNINTSILEARLEHFFVKRETYHQKPFQFFLNSKMKIVFLLAVVAAVLISEAYCLSCPCWNWLGGKEAFCKESKKPKLTDADCPYGVGKDHCACCDKCINGPGDKCGGPWNVYGGCAEGFKCDKDDDDFNAHGTCKQA